ncbi:MAG: hypothetical protein JJE04_26875 [Acidobacteriia bacterium]|nr:hypothetical protein [Terriglobia bacterium]
MTTTIKQAKATETTKIALTPELSAALRQAYFCCREIGSRNESDYEIESMQAAEQIRTALRAVGADPEAADAYRARP